MPEGKQGAVLPPPPPSPRPPETPETPAEEAAPPPPLPPAAFVEEAGRCANCLSLLTGPFCAQCGQHVADYHRSVWRFVADFFENAFSWDNKFFRTLGPLLRRPGWLTQEFMAGRRVRYVHPLRLFLFTSAICLTLLQSTHNGVQARANKAREAKRIAAVNKARAIVKAKDEDDNEDTADAAPSPSRAPVLLVPPVSPAPSAAPVASDPPAASAAPSPADPPVTTPASDSLGSIMRDALKNADKGNHAQATVNQHLDALSDSLQKKIDAAGGIQKFNERVTTNVQSKLSWVALAMLPIFALLMRVFFGRKGGYYFTYLVFSLHYHTFLLMFWLAYAWVDALALYFGSSLLHIVAALTLLVPPWYLFRALRQMYGQGWTVTASKVFAIGAAHLLTLFAGLAMIGATAFL